MDLGQLKKAVIKIPQRPGIYIFKDFRNKPLYIGKALNLKNRVSFYLKTGDIRLKKIIEATSFIKYIATDSDIEALIIESQYIKRYKPSFNIMLRDDKQYFYVGFTQEKFPKLTITHRPPKVAGHQLLATEYIGPFTDGSALKSSLRLLRRIFPYCICKQKHYNFCLNYHIGRCFGFCCLREPLASIRYQVLKNYLENIKAIKEVLHGGRTSLIKHLEKDMKKLGEKEKFKEAIELKRKIGKLKRVFENARILQNKTIEKRGVNILTQLTRILKLQSAPYLIEGYDISNNQGAHATGAMVVFENGKPNKSNYRKFRIRAKSGPDDITMIKEVLARRFNHPAWPYPDLIFIDGGKAQLNAARYIVQGAGLEIPVFSLAKGKNEIFSTTLAKPFPLTKLNQDLKNLIKNIDAEAHRFALSYYRKLHRKRLSEFPLLLRNN